MAPREFTGLRESLKKKNKNKNHIIRIYMHNVYTCIIYIL